MDKFISLLLSTKPYLEMGLSGMNVSPAPLFINGRGASQQKHIVSCATICVYFPLHVFVCNRMCVCVCADFCSAHCVWLIKVR